MKKKPLFNDDEGFYMNDDGYVVFKREFLLQRGYCCGNGCVHCPFEYKNVIDVEKKNRMLANRNKHNKTENE
jgi:hypothetical protein